jgi:hypothetical protein
MAKTALRVKQDSQTEVPRTRLHPVPAMRQAQGGLSQIRPLPDLPARNGAPGRATRHHEEFLVMNGLRRSATLLPGQPPDLRRLRSGARPIHVRKAALQNGEEGVTGPLDAGSSRPQEDYGTGPDGNHSEKEDHANS